jgi:hypothetical protein
MCRHMGVVYFLFAYNIIMYIVTMGITGICILPVFYVIFIVRILYILFYQLPHLCW